MLLPVVTRLESLEGRVGYHLWVGQKNRCITVFDAENLSIVDFLESPDDVTECHKYLSQLPFQYLTSSIEEGDQDWNPESSCIGTNVSESVWVYGALRHGQFVTVWDGSSRKIKMCLNVLDLLPQWKGMYFCWFPSDIIHYHFFPFFLSPSLFHVRTLLFLSPSIYYYILDDIMPAVSALYHNTNHLYIGLVTGEILVLDSTHLSLLTSLHCHRYNVHSFLSIDLRKLLPTQQHQYQSSGSAMTPSVFPSYPFLNNTDPTDIKYKTGPLQLMSFGTGFR